MCPQLPQYNSQGKLYTDKPETIRAGAEKPYENISQNIGKVMNIVSAWGEALDTIQYTTAKANYETGLLNIENRAANDPEYNNEAKYHSELNKLKENSLKGFSNPQVQSKAALEFDYGNQVTQIKIGNIYKKKQIEVGKASLQTGINALLKKKLHAGSVSEINQIEVDMKSMLQENVAKGIINPDDALKMMYDAEVMAAEYDIKTNPQYALDQLARKEKGMYKNLPDLKRVELMDDAQKEIDKQIAEDSKQQIMNYATNEDMIRDKDINGELVTVEEIKSLRDRGLIRAPFALAKIKSLTSARAVDAKTDIRVFEEIFGNITNRDISATEIREKIYTMNAKGKLSNSDVKRLLFVEKGEGISSVYEDFVLEQEELENKKKKVLPKRSFWGTAISIVKETLGFNQEKVMRDIVDRAQKENAQEEQILQIATDTVRKQILIDNPAIARLPEKGFLCRDKFGNTAIVYPDGTYEEVMKSTGEFKHKEQRKKEEAK